jgi:rhamnosyltransferase
MTQTLKITGRSNEQNGSADEMAPNRRIALGPKYGEARMLECSISILTKNEEQNIGACLEAVFSQQGVGEFEVTLVDSGSTDATLEIARGYPVRIEQIAPHEFHHARTRNFAASLGKGPILINLSGDAIPASKTWLSGLLGNFSDPQVGAAYGRQLPRPGSTAERSDTFDTIYGSKRIVKDPAHRNGLGYRFYHFSDVNSALRRSVWEANPYPEELKMFEDLAIAKVILDAGWKIVYEPDAPVYHSHRYNSKQLFKRYFDIGYTLKELKIWDSPGTRKSLLRDFRNLVKRQVTRVTKAENKQRDPSAVWQSFAKSAGFVLGLNQRFLPLTVKKHLSSYRAFE